MTNRKYYQICKHKMFMFPPQQWQGGMAGDIEIALGLFWQE
jgi:hypothetical protein